MKTLILRIFGIVFILFGLACFGVVMEDLGKGNHQDLFLGFALATCLLVIGFLVMRVPKAKYHLSWTLGFGVILTFLGIAMAAMEFDDLAGGKSQDLVIGFALAGIFVVSGVLLIRSGHRHHMKLLRSNPGEPSQNEAVQTADAAES